MSGAPNVADLLVLGQSLDVAVMQIFHKLETLTLCHIDYKELPPPEVLKSLTRLSIPATAKSFFKGATSE